MCVHRKGGGMVISNGERERERVRYAQVTC